MSKKKVDADPETQVAGQGFVEEFCTKAEFDQDGVQASAAIGLDGKEYGDPVPMAPPVGFEQPPDLMEMMRTMIRNDAMQRALDAEGFDTEEEAADFDVDDDPLPPLTFHEAILQPPPAGPPAEVTPAPAPGPQAPAPAPAAAAPPPTSTST